jgi:hypothetical protein
MVSHDPLPISDGLSDGCHPTFASVTVFNICVFRSFDTSGALFRILTFHV